MANRDFGSKIRSGGMATKQDEERARRDRLRELALQTIDLKKDPYLMRNHLGSYECKLCLTLHNNESNYLVHTQGRRHQQNILRRQQREARMNPNPQPLVQPKKKVVRKIMRIGTPGYKVVKQRDAATGQMCLLFQLEYPDIDKNVQPRHRFMSAFEQRREQSDRRFQYLLFAADPYETVAFKIENKEIDKSEGKFITFWDRDRKIFTLQLQFLG